MEEQTLGRIDEYCRYFGKMDDHLVHTTPNHHPPEMDVIQKTFLKIILAAN